MRPRPPPAFPRPQPPSRRSADELGSSRWPALPESPGLAALLPLRLWLRRQSGEGPPGLRVRITSGELLQPRGPRVCLRPVLSLGTGDQEARLALWTSLHVLIPRVAGLSP